MPIEQQLMTAARQGKPGGVGTSGPGGKAGGGAGGKGGGRPQGESPSGAYGDRRPGPPSLGVNRLSAGGQIRPPMPVFSGGQMISSDSGFGGPRPLPPGTRPGTVFPRAPNAPAANIPVTPDMLR